MDVSTVTAPTGGLLAAVRATLAEADEALLCVAFVQSRGVHLVADELTGVARRRGARVVVTTVFGKPESTAAALAAITGSGASLRVLNPSGATFHPKVVLGRRKRAIHAVVGSANLTSGLVANVEAATVMHGTAADAPLAQLWAWAEGIWSDPRADAWAPPAGAHLEEEIEPELLRALIAATRGKPKLYTLGTTPRPNYVAEISPTGLWLETDRSRAMHEGPQLVPPRMLNLAWETLRATGRLSSPQLQGKNSLLRIHRSSAVLAALRELPGVRQVSTRPIVLEYTPLAGATR